MGTGWGAQRVRRLAAACLAIAALVSIAPGTAGTASTSRTYSYVALGSMYVIGPDLAAGMVRSSLGVDIAPLGQVEGVAERDRIALRIDDHGTLAGTIHVSVSNGFSGSSHWTHRHLCIPVREATEIGGITPGQIVSVAIWDGPAFYTNGCDHGGTAGTASITF